MEFSPAWVLLRHEPMASADLLREIASLLARRKSRGEMAGDFLREIAVLLVVFVPLEAVFNPGALRWPQIAVIVGLALGIGYIGMRIEERQ